MVFDVAQSPLVLFISLMRMHRRLCSDAKFIFKSKTRSDSVKRFLIAPQRFEILLFCFEQFKCLTFQGGRKLKGNFWPPSSELLHLCLDQLRKSTA